MYKHHCVARNREISQLNSFLSQAMDSTGQVCFVTGEAGSGKTTLVTEFARLAQQEHKELVVAMGQSDSQTGIGDPYLPFRELLAQLTGDVDTKLAQGAFSEENADRLRKLLVISGQALVELGPDLIGIFVPGVGLATRTAAFLAEQMGWMDKLEQHVKKPRFGADPLKSEIEQSRILEQYTNVLVRLAEKKPLLLILDDLQWADTASIGLLFRLGRRIGKSRILVVGTYRPEELSLGREGKRHPLEKVLAEFKRYYGDTSIDLDQVIHEEGLRFVDAFLGTEPNRFRKDFRDALYHHTGGHPLFTVELLRDMQERGDLIKDGAGCWVEGDQLDWENLPARVEGVLEERIGRLDEESRQVLTIASVEGENFTAEVVAGVHSLDERAVISRLSRELERQHRLVSAIGVKRLNGQRLSMYRFQHNMFQNYLYGEIDEVERSCLHEDVGITLEALYGDQAEEAAVQLVRHFNRAGLIDKTRFYLRVAGEQAADHFAYDEALRYFDRALTLSPEDGSTERFAILLNLGRIYFIQGEHQAQARNLAALEALAELVDSDQYRAKVALQRAKYAHAISDYQAAVDAARYGVKLAHSTEDISIEAEGYFLWGNSLWHQSEYDLSLSMLGKAVALAKQADLSSIEAASKGCMGLVAVWQGNYPIADMHYQEALQMFREIQNREGESNTLLNFGTLYNNQGDFAKAKEYFKQALQGYYQIGDRKGEAIALGNLGVTSANQGDLQGARVHFERSRVASHEIGDRYAEGLSLFNLGQVCADLGDFLASTEFFKQALEIKRAIGDRHDESIVLVGFGSSLTKQGDYHSAREKLELSVQIANEIGDQITKSNALLSLGILSDCSGDSKSAKEYYESSLKIARENGNRREEGLTLAYLGLLYHHMGNNHSAQEHCQQALDIAQDIGDPNTEAYAFTNLGHALADMDHLDEAVDAYQKAVDLRREMGQSNLIIEPLSGIASILLTQSALSKAQDNVEQILDHMEVNSVDGTDEPFQIYLTCYHVLQANGDHRAVQILESAYQIIQERAAKIPDEDLRRSFLENIPWHQEIIRLWEKQ